MLGRGRRGAEVDDVHLVMTARQLVAGDAPIDGVKAVKPAKDGVPVCPKSERDCWCAVAVSSPSSPAVTWALFQALDLLGKVVASSAFLLAASRPARAAWPPCWPSSKGQRCRHRPRSAPEVGSSAWALATDHALDVAAQKRKERAVRVQYYSGLQEEVNAVEDVIGQLHEEPEEVADREGDTWRLVDACRSGGGERARSIEERVAAVRNAIANGAKINASCTNCQSERDASLRTVSARFAWQL